MAKRPNVSEEERQFMEFVNINFEEPKKRSGLRKTADEVFRNIGNIDKAISRGFASGSETLFESFGRTLPQSPEEERPLTRFAEEQLQRTPDPERLEEDEEPDIFEQLAERGGRILPFALSGRLFGGQTGSAREALVRSGAAGAAGETAEQAFGPIPGAVAEMGAFSFPSMGKQIQPTSAQEEFVQFARSQGLTEEQIAPLLQEDTALTRTLGGFSRKGRRAEKAIEAAKEGQNTAFANLEALPEAQSRLTTATQNTFFKESEKILRDLPNDVRQQIASDFGDFLNSDRTAGDLVNLWQDINFQFQKRGGNRLQRLKEPIKNALQEINPNFADQFELTNDLSKRFFRARKNLTPNQSVELAEKFRLASAPAQLAWGITTGNFPIIAELVGEFGARELSRELLINPRFQNLSGKMVTAIKKNSAPLAKSAFNDMVKSLQKAQVDQETIDKLQDVDIDEFIEQFNLKDDQK